MYLEAVDRNLAVIVTSSPMMCLRVAGGGDIAKVKIFDACEVGMENFRSLNMLREVINDVGHRKEGRIWGHLG